MYRKNNNEDINEIIPHLFVSNWETSNNPEIIKKYNIKAVITLETTPKPFNIVKYYEINNIAHMYIYLQDIPTANIYRYFDQSFNFIKSYIKYHENVLVHCAAGVSRSVTIVLNYMIRNIFETQFVRGQNSNDIINYVLYVAKLKRPFINPNSGFLKQLDDKTNEYIFGG